MEESTQLNRVGTKSESGEPLTLTIEGAGPSGLRAIGVNANSIAVGEHVTAVVSPSRRYPGKSAYGIAIIRGDGGVVPLTRNPSEAQTQLISSSSSSIFGTWSPPFSAMMGILQSRSSWFYTESGRVAFESYNPTMSSQAECIPVSAPWLMMHPVVHEIERYDDRIVIRSDWMGAERTVYLDGRNRPPTAERFQQGHSLGHWEDDVLVVETMNFIDRIYAGLASSGGKSLTERFTLGKDGKSLVYSFVLEDPEYLVEPVSGSILMDFRPDLEPSSIECDPELAGRYLEEFQ